jgi:SAM-dependent methyltransferase
VKVTWVERPCPLCGSADQSHVVAESNIDLAQLNGFAFASRKRPEYMHPRLIQCPACSLWYGSPVLSSATLSAAYEAADFDSGVEARYASASYAAEIRKYLPHLPDRNGALDIGTGDGAFMERLIELGFQNVAGVEPSAAPRAAAKPGIRESIRPGLFRQEEFPTGQLSLVTCFQTMEHVPEPMALVRGARALLKPGGAFAMVVHNREALSARILGFRCPIFDIEHLQLFSPDTARMLLERAGYRDVQIATFLNRYPLAYWLKLLPFPYGIKSLLLAVANGTGLGRLPIALPAGNLVCVAYEGGAGS